MREGRGRGGMDLPADSLPIMKARGVDCLEGFERIDLADIRKEERDARGKGIF